MREPITRIDGARLVGAAGGPDSLVDVRLAGGRIVAVQPAQGPLARVRLARKGVLEADGAWLMPGLWDAHVHPRDWAAARHRLDLAGCVDRGEVLARVGREVAARTGGAVGTAADSELIGVGVWHAGWPEPPEVAALDAVTGAMPTVLISGDLHSAWFNTAALGRYTLAQPADGLVAEAAWFAVMTQVGTADEATRDRWVIEAGQAAAALGVVGLTDLDPGDSHAAWRRRVAAGFDTHRVRASVWPDRLNAAISAGLKTGDAVPGAGPLLRMGPLKVISDGSLNTRTAWCHEPYSDGHQGGPNLTEAELTDLMGLATAAGIECAIHAIGDRANTVALTVFERTGARGRIEHAQLLTDTDVTRMARLGVRASIQPSHTVTDREVVDLLWARQAPRAYRFADLHRAGVRLELGSDAPVSPLDPWQAIRDAVHRTRDDRPAWYPQQRLDLATALRASWGPVAEVRPGGPADLVLLDRHPNALASTDPVCPQALATICAGRLTHRAS